MIVFNKANLRPFDVDDTLVMHQDPIRLGGEPITSFASITNPYSGVTDYYYRNDNMIKLLREEHARGGTVVVWSRRGWQWAEAVVLALALQDVVQLVLEKPLVYFDDKDVSEWLKDRIYIGPNESFK